MTTPSKLTLTYFDMAGRAEPVRMMLKYAGVAFDDVRITRPEFATKKSQLQLPFKQLPTLQVDGVVFAQSLAISRYVARLTGLYPEHSPLAALEADLAVDALTEAAFAMIRAVVQERDEDRKKQLLIDANETILPRLLGGLEERAVGPYYLGNSISYPDFYVLDFYRQIWTGFGPLIKLSVDDYPKLKSIATLLGASPSLQN
ncbi:unnamed protein product [Aphanomyces euteiches]|uniref:Glutathione S-transferase n=1 Tax=Aphanomyces euteiches TaxID=100861 RepID=A0A6G0X314_9STRA|nr:hypothetical protein Ae201684_008979 [Aphanomyces euteiches]KAH9054401.1 hypothetical protein Ae201684P_018122 [Aphanomyces euteiches]KAH9128284.1 hypothetical protein AeMF1_001546 [Aphanomyces euteiches]KAH9130572.1 hypothetical protein LEN26_008394 [Aphanomyces euteiches]KAH9195781.1 hypothetical protein AeNC1_002244 [Aphanomyces euteiches]